MDRTNSSSAPSSSHTRAQGILQIHQAYPSHTVSPTTPPPPPSLPPPPKQGVMSRLLDSHRLVLVLDLDHTLVNSVKFNEVDPEWEYKLEQQVAEQVRQDMQGGGEEQGLDGGRGARVGQARVRMRAQASEQGLTNAGTLLCPACMQPVGG